MIDPDQFDELMFYRIAQREDLALFVGANFSDLAPGQTFRMNWHIAAIAHALQEVEAGRIRRLLITMPPRSLKSTLASVAFPAWLLGRDPRRRIVCISHTIDLVVEHANACRRLMQTPAYQAIFPGAVLSRTKSTETEFKMLAGGYRLSVSVGGPLTGRGGSDFLIDDPIKAADGFSEAKRKEVLDWYRTTLLSRLDDPNTGAIIVVMQRLHEDDLAGHLIETGGFTHLNLPAIADLDQDVPIGPGLMRRFRAGDLLDPNRLPRDFLESQILQMGEGLFSAQYLQAPAPAGGALIKRDWLRFEDAPEDYLPGTMIVASWDIAAKTGDRNDYSVCTIWMRRGEAHYLLDVFRAKLNYPDLRKAVLDMQARWSPAATLIEDTVSGTPLIQEVRALQTGPNVIAVKPMVDKQTRLIAQSYKFETGRVFFPPDAPWLDALVLEVLSFPRARHDDQVDSITQYLEWRGAVMDCPSAFGAVLFKGGED